MKVSDLVKALPLQEPFYLRLPATWAAWGKEGWNGGTRRGTTGTEPSYGPLPYTVPPACLVPPQPEALTLQWVL